MNSGETNNKPLSSHKIHPLLIYCDKLEASSTYLEKKNSGETNNKPLSSDEMHQLIVDFDKLQAKEIDQSLDMSVLLSSSKSMEFQAMDIKKEKGKTSPEKENEVGIVDYPITSPSEVHKRNERRQSKPMLPKKKEQLSKDYRLSDAKPKKVYNSISTSLSEVHKRNKRRHSKSMLPKKKTQLSHDIYKLSDEPKSSHISFSLSEELERMRPIMFRIKRQLRHDIYVEPKSFPHISCSLSEVHKRNKRRHSKPMLPKKKTQLSHDIYKLSDEEFRQFVRIIQLREKCSLVSSYRNEMDIELITPSRLEELKNYVSSCFKTRRRRSKESVNQNYYKGKELSFKEKYSVYTIWMDFEKIQPSTLRELKNYVSLCLKTRQRRSKESVNQNYYKGLTKMFSRSCRCSSD